MVGREWEVGPDQGRAVVNVEVEEERRRVEAVEDVN
jgi:hypothetical protein